MLINGRSLPELYPLSLHDALPISIETSTGVDLFVFQEAYDSFLLLQYKGMQRNNGVSGWSYKVDGTNLDAQLSDRKSTRLNSSHSSISYAVFCLKKKKYDWRY